VTMCIDCGRAPAADGRRVCDDDCLATFIRDWERCHGLPPGGRDPAEVEHELACRRGAALLLHGRLTRHRDDETAGMTLVLAECHARPGLTPAAALVGPALTLATWITDPWRDPFAGRLRDAGAIATAEAQVTDDGELARDCRATEAAAGVMRGRLTGDQELEAHGWTQAGALAAEHDATAAGLLLGPILGLTDDHLRGAARERLVDTLRDVLMTWAPVPDTAAGLTDLDDDAGGAP
jgi:hypothetical protein